jgi:hypothetical protein
VGLVTAWLDGLCAAVASLILAYPVVLLAALVGVTLVMATGIAVGMWAVGGHTSQQQLPAPAQPARRVGCAWPAYRSGRAHRSRRTLR